MKNGPLLSDVDLLTREHGVDVMPQSGLFGKFNEKAYRLFSSDAEVVYCYGWALCASKRFADAESVLSKAVALEPNKTDAHYNNAVALGALDRWKESASEFQKTIGLDPMRGDAHCGLGTA